MNRRRRYDRTERGRGRCADCGRPKGIGCKEFLLCSRCRRDKRRAARLLRGQQIEQWWYDGLLLTEIARKLGWGVAALCSEMTWLRKHGFNLPYRRA